MTRRALLLAGFLLLVGFHQNSWSWHDPDLFLGIPAGLLFHALLCVAAAGLFAILVCKAGSPDGDL